MGHVGPVGARPITHIVATRCACALTAVIPPLRLFMPYIHLTKYRYDPTGLPPEPRTLWLPVIYSVIEVFFHFFPLISFYLPTFREDVACRGDITQCYKYAGDALRGAQWTESRFHGHR